MPRGIVCDACNNYFGRKVEQPLLDSDHFRHTRHRNLLPNKRGIFPTIEGIYGPEGIELGFSRDRKGSTAIYPVHHAEWPRFRDHVLTHRRFLFIAPFPAPAEERLISRLLAKIGLEVLTQRVMKEPGWEDAVIFRTELDEVREYARYGGTGKTWPFSVRRIYSENHPFMSEAGELYEVLHEFTILYTVEKQLIVVVAIMGVEYAINTINPETEIYKRWLTENDHRSPLWPDGLV